MTYQINTFQSKQELLINVAEAFVQRITNILRKDKQCRIVLGGGKTPVELNKIIVENCSLIKCDWSRLHIYFSDERIVSEAHPDNTATMIRNTLAIPLNLPSDSVHPIPSHMKPQMAAVTYSRELVSLKKSINGPLFHLALLGLGPDGHTASLFPGSSALRERIRYAVPGGKGPEGWERVTLTKPALEDSDQIWVVAAGKEKRNVINKMINGPPDPETFPLQLIDHKKNQVVLWLCDKSMD